MHFSAIFGSYNYDPVKQKFESKRCDDRDANNTDYTRLMVDKWETTTISTPTDPPLGGRHGRHTDKYPTGFLDLRAGVETTPPHSKSSARPSKPVTRRSKTSARSRNNHINHPTTTETQSFLRMKSTSVKNEKQHNKNAVK